MKEKIIIVKNELRNKVRVFNKIIDTFEKSQMFYIVSVEDKIKFQGLYKHENVEKFASSKKWEHKFVGGHCCFYRANIEVTFTN